MKELESNRSLRYTRGNQKIEVNDLIKLMAEEGELESITLFKLLNAYKRTLEKYKNKTEKVVHVVSPYKYTTESEKEKLTSFILKKGKASFVEIFENCENKIHAVFMFLGMLELIQQQIFSIIIGEGNNNFWLSSVEEE
jgi:segregation and condensation protein A